MQAISDTVVAREFNSCLCAGNNIIRAEGISGIWEGYRKHGRATVLEGVNHAAEGRGDGIIEKLGKHSYILYHICTLKSNNRRGHRTYLRNSDVEFDKVSRDRKSVV